MRCLLQTGISLSSKTSSKRKRADLKEKRNERQADTKDLTSSSKFSASCVLTSQTIPKLEFTNQKMLLTDGPLIPLCCWSKPRLSVRWDQESYRMGTSPNCRILNLGRCYFVITNLSVSFLFLAAFGLFFTPAVGFGPNSLLLHQSSNLLFIKRLFVSKFLFFEAERF